MDSGDILLQEPLDIAERETCESLTRKVADLGADYIIDVVNKIEQNTLSPVSQDNSKATFCSLIGKNDGRIHWCETAAYLDRLIRAYTPWPHGFTNWRGQRLNILEAHILEDDSSDEPAGKVLGVDKSQGILIKTGQGLLAVTRLQLQSKKPLDFKSFLNGTKDFIGSVLGDADES